MLGWIENHVLSLIVSGSVVLACVTALSRNEHVAKRVYLGGTLFVFMLFLVLNFLFDSNAPMIQFFESYSWISSIGIKISLGLDGINLVLLLLVSGVFSLLASGIVFFEPRATRILFSRMIFLEALVILCLSTFDFLAFVIFWEILCWIICLSGRPPQDEKAKMLTNFPMILNSLGSLVLIFSILTLSFYHKYEHHVFSTSLLDLVSLEFFNSAQQKWVFFSPDKQNLATQ